ncbi:MAG: response regulator [Candidatus Omnitrophica bacterium]|nr:response regulator [Candidatus Omnitrophota bacterium]
MQSKILIVDDEPDVLDVISKRLQAEGFSTVTAHDGIEGLLAAEREKPSLILLDIMMPRRDGFTMLADLQTSDSLRRVPVIMVSAKAETDSLFEGQRIGATDYIIKPIDFDELLRYIRKYI